MAKKKVKRKTKTAQAKSSTLVPQEPEKRLIFHYIKSPSFRVIRVDGIHGSPTPAADGIQMALFSERNPIPKREEYLFDQDGKLGKRVLIKRRNGLVREVEIEAILSMKVARALYTWLGEKIAQTEALAARGTSNGK